MPEVVNEAPPSVLVSLARDLTVAEGVVESLEAKLKEAKGQAEVIEKKLVEEMITQQVKSFKAEGLGGFRTQGVVYPNVKDKEIFTEYLEKEKLDWLYSKSVNGNKLRAYVRELMENGKPIPPGIDPYTTIVIRKF